MITRSEFSPDPGDILEIMNWDSRNESVKFRFQIITLIEAVWYKSVQSQVL